MTWTIFIAALVTVESSNGPNPPPGKNGEVGPLQITQDALDDVNRIHGWTFTLEDMRDLSKARLVCIFYLRHWGAKIPGRDPTWRDYARIWNGGPRGWEKDSTLPYWRKVRLVILTRIDKA